MLPAKLAPESQDLAPESQDLNELASTLGLGREVLETILQLGRRPAPERLRQAILAVCQEQWVSGQQLSALLGRNLHALVRDHLTGMVERGDLQRKHDDVNHPQQAYRAKQLAIREPS